MWLGIVVQSFKSVPKEVFVLLPHVKGNKTSKKRKRW